MIELIVHTEGILLFIKNDDIYIYIYICISSKMIYIIHVTYTCK